MVSVLVSVHVVSGAIGLGSAPQGDSLVCCIREGAQPLRIENHDAAATQLHEPSVGEVTEDACGGFAGGADEVGKLLVGQAQRDCVDLTRRIRRIDASQRRQCRRDTCRNGSHDGVGQASLERGNPFAELFGDPTCDALVRKEQSLNVVSAHQTHDAGLKGLSPRPIHALTEQDHLAEDLTGVDESRRQASTVGADPVDTNASLLENEKNLMRIMRAEQHAPSGEVVHRRGLCDRGHLVVREVGEEIDF